MIKTMPNFDLYFKWLSLYVRLSKAAMMLRSKTFRAKSIFVKPSFLSKNPMMISIFCGKEIWRAPRPTPSTARSQLRGLKQPIAAEGRSKSMNIVFNYSATLKTAALLLLKFYWFSVKNWIAAIKGSPRSVWETIVPLNFELDYCRNQWSWSFLFAIMQ